MKYGGYTYIMTNKNNTIFYTGVTSNLIKRVNEHKGSVFPKSYTSRYNATKLVYFEGFNRIEEAIAREKQIKGGSRKKKIELISSLNPGWMDLFDSL